MTVYIVAKWQQGTAKDTAAQLVAAGFTRARWSTCKAGTVLVATK